MKSYPFNWRLNFYFTVIEVVALFDPVMGAPTVSGREFAVTDAFEAVKAASVAEFSGVALALLTRSSI